MSTRTLGALFLIVASVACESNPTQETNQDFVDQYVESHPVEKPTFPEPQAAADGRERRSGRWTLVDGSLVCDGYLTRFSSQEFCQAQVPEDWETYLFDGKTYYVQRLSRLGN